MPFHHVLLRFLGLIAVAVITGLVVSGLAIPWAQMTGVAAKSGADAVDDLPVNLEVGKLSETTRILDRNGKLITTLYDQNRVYRPLAQIAPAMSKALLATEDSRFYKHGAMDLKGTLRALITNQTDDGNVQGGSSITQQLVKQILFYNARTDAERKAATADTAQRKVKELRYAIAMEKQYSKDWILERYLNTANFGDGAYGVQAAARHYFDVDAKSLTWPQAAMLAGMVKNPTGYDPTNNPDAAIARRNTVLDRLVATGDLQRDDAEKLKTTALGLHVQRQRNGCLGTQAEFFCQYAINWLAKDPSLGATEADRRRLLQTGGLTIKTTLDPRFQKAAQRAVAHNVSPTDHAVGALAMVEPGTGHIKALAQSRPMGENKAKGESYLNYLVPKEYGDANGFQAGSTFKVFVAATAIAHGFPLHQQINSPPKKTFPGSSFRNCPGAGGFGDPWPVSNSTTSGMKNLYTGTRESVNTFYAQVEQFTGVCEPYALAQKMGVLLTDPKKERFPPFTLGIADVSPLEMAEAYATLGARGKHCANRPVTEIDGPDGKPVKKYADSCQQVMAQGTADAINDILQGVMRPGGFGQSLALRVPSAGKTGTINSNKAVWFNGYTPTLATAAVIAGANFEGTQITLNGQHLNGHFIATAHGSTVAGPMWGEAMKAIDGDLPYRGFVKPPAAIVNGRTVAVPKVKGMSVAAASARLRAAGFKVVVGRSARSRHKAGTVISVNPGSRAAKGSPITLTVSRGRR